MNHRLVIQTLVRPHTSISDVERFRRKALRVRCNLGKLFDAWKIEWYLDFDRLAQAGLDCVDPRRAWVDYIERGLCRRKLGVNKYFHLAIRSALLDYNGKRCMNWLRAFGEQFLRALHMPWGFSVRKEGGVEVISAVAGDFVAIGDGPYAYTVDASAGWIWLMGGV